MPRGRYRERPGATRARSTGFTPFSVPQPPPGFYDPALDAAQGAARRGLGDLAQDTRTGNARDTTDYGLGRDAIVRARTRGLEDIGSDRTALEQGYGRSVFDTNREYDRGAADLGTARQRGDEDYQRNVSMLQRRYQQLGGGQRQQQSRAGVMRGGAMLQAAAKRQANEALDRQPLDTGYQRFGADNQLALGRLGENRDTALARFGEDRQTGLDALGRAETRLGDDSNLQLGDLALKFAPPDAANPLGGRSFQDRSTALLRGQRENTNFGLDTSAQRYYQAAGQGWSPPQMPSNEFVDASGQHRQIQVRGNQAVTVDPSGRVLRRRPRGRR